MNKYLVALTYLDNLGPVTLQKILEKMPAEQIWQADFLDFRKIGLAEKISQTIISQRQKIDPDKIVEQVQKEKISILTIFDDNYPPLLKEIYAPPVVLYYRGDISTFQNQSPTLAVVGSRKISNYAKLVMPDLLIPAIKKEAMIISGLAHGVDALAHQLALDNGGKTAAVLGSGLAWDYFYPKSNKYLADKILASGSALISEFAPQTLAQKFNFPRRNRIISGLSKATLIVEAGEKSGALITASYALEQNREVLAVPGNINQLNSLGTNNLIKKGARAVTCAADIFEALELYYQSELKQKIDYTQANENEQLLLKILSALPLNIDKIIEHCTLDVSLINSTLLKMELKGWVKNVGGQNYVKS